MMPNLRQQKVKELMDRPLTWPIYTWDKPWNEIKFDLIREEEWQSPATLQGGGMNDPYTIVTNELNRAREDIAALEYKLNHLEKRSGLMSKSWINRVFTTWGYFLIAQVMIGLVVLFLGLIFGLLN